MKQHKSIRLFTAFLCFLMIFSSISISVLATSQDYLAEAETRKNDPVESNNIENWPQGPLIGAKAAVLMEANTGAILYCKNMDEALFPASITKLMTCLIAVENCSLDELITVNQSAIDANEPDGSSMSLVAGEQLTLEELLHGILISSANEACNVVAEHIAGSMENFVEMMNARAVELGCTNTHFVTTNGLHSEDHYTTAHDMALIGQAFFNHDILCKLSCISEYHIEANAYHEEHWLHSKNNLYEGKSYYYESIVGSKTGFTSISRQTLVSCAERNGMKLICVILMEESPYQFEDTINLFEYGFSNFSTAMISSYGMPYEINHSDFFNTDNDIFGSTSPIISMDHSAKIILPNNVNFYDTEFAINYQNTSGDELANIDYNYHGMYLGSAAIRLTSNSTPEFAFNDHFDTEESENAEEENSAKNQIFINIYKVFIAIIVIAIIVCVALAGYKILKNYHFDRKRISKIKKRRRTVYKKQPVRKPVRTAERSGLNYRKSRKSNPFTWERSNTEATVEKTSDRRQTNINRPANKKTSSRATGVPNQQNWTKRNNINFHDFDLK